MSTAQAAAGTAPAKPPMAHVVAELRKAEIVPTTARPPIALALIDESPFNPRKAFNDIEDLAGSIAEQGLLEGILLRPGKKPGRFELVFGARRLRAMRHLKWEAVTNYDVRELSDAEAKAAQIVENLQRADVTPLEEAEGFARLQDEDPKKWTAMAIAKVIGKTDRFVQQRLTIARGLDPDLKKKFAKGDLKVEVVRTVAALPTSLQERLKKESWGLKNNNVNQLDQEIRNLVVPVERAAFEEGLYKGDFIADGAKRFFVDVGQFDKLQNAAAQSVVDKLRAGLWKTAKLIKADDVSDYCWGDNLQRVYSFETKAKSTGKAKVAVEKLTAIVWLDSYGKIRQATGVVPAGEAGKVRESGGNPARETAAQRRTRFDFNERLAIACVAKPDVGTRAMLVALVGSYGARMAYDTPALKKARASFLPEALAKIEAGHGDRTTQTWGVVKAMKIEDVHKALAGYASLAFFWDSHHGKKPKGFTSTLGILLKIVPREVEPPSKVKSRALADKVAIDPNAKVKGRAELAKLSTAAKAKKKAARK